MHSYGSSTCRPTYLHCNENSSSAEYLTVFNLDVHQILLIMIEVFTREIHIGPHVRISIKVTYCVLHLHSDFTSVDLHNPII